MQPMTKLEVAAPDTLLEQKTALAVEATDELMFQGSVKGMLNSLASMVGMPRLSIGEILPQRNKANLKPFLASLSSTILAVLDEQVGYEQFARVLAEHIAVIRRIGEEEKSA